MPVSLSTALLYYKRLDVQNALVDGATDKEIAVSYGGQGYGKRPDTLQYPKDIIEFAKNGATSFHCSEELWINPLQITTGAKRNELDALRKGWDLILDIDCVELTYSKIAGDLLVQALKYHDIKNIFVKFSGNHGFHIAVPFESFPDSIHGTPIKDWFPDGPRKIANYLAHFIKPQLGEALLKFHDINEIKKRVGKTQEELVKNNQFDPFNVLKIDTVLIAPRHLYRMPYSLNEKSGLVSVPIDADKILAFDKASASPEKVTPNREFIIRNKANKNEASKLFIRAFDYVAKETVRKNERDEYAPKKDFAAPTEALAETLFPPCIKNASLGMKDGKKRALFAIVNFLTSVGWDYDKILEWLKEWNKKNPEQLSDTIIEGHVRYHKQAKKKMLPPNCKQTWEEIGLCKPDGLCARIKNPVTYATRKAWMLNLDKADKKEEQSKTNGEFDYDVR